MEKRSINILKEEKDEQKRWDCLTNNIWEVAKQLKMISKGQGKGCNKAYWGEDYNKHRKRAWKLFKKWFRTKREEDKKEYKIEKKLLKEIKEKVKKEREEEKYREVELSNGTKEFWEAIKKFRPRKKNKGGNIKKKEWEEHFKNLLGASEGGSVEEVAVNREVENNDDSELGGLNEEISQIEIKKALKNMKNNKAAGEDGIVVEFLKELPQKWESELVEIINSLFLKARLLKAWETARIFPIYKAGNEDEVKNYRGVSLLDVGYKVITNIMAGRIRYWLESKGKLKESQAGFRGKRGTRDHLFTLNSVVGNKIKEKGGKIFAMFIDFRTAFDVVDRKLLLAKVEKIGIKGKILEMIKEIYRKTRNEVITKQGLSDSFETRKGVRQGCPLSPTLFNIFIDDIEEEWVRKNEGGVVIGGQKIFCLKFADDIIAMSENKEGLNSMIRDLEKYCRKNKMEVNVDKTKIMIFRNGGRTKKNDQWEFKGKKLEVVKEYKYLGFWFNERNNIDDHMRKMAEKAQKTMNAVWGIWKRARIGNLEKRLYLLDTIVKSACFYGVEIWGWQRNEIIEKVQKRYVKMAMGLDRNTPDYLWRMESGRKSWEIEAKRRAGEYLLNILKKDKERWVYKGLKEEIRGELNNRGSKWAKKLSTALKEAGYGETLKAICGRICEETEINEIKKISDRLDFNTRVRAEQEIQLDWGKIEKSSYNENYKYIKTEVEEENYWKGNHRGDLKEQWARMRCGNIGRGGNKGYKEIACRLCGQEEENLEHSWVCKKAREKVNEKWVREVNKWGLQGSRSESIKKEMELLKGKLIPELCEYSKEYEKLLRTSAEIEN